MLNKNTNSSETRADAKERVLRFNISHLYSNTSLERAYIFILLLLSGFLRLTQLEFSDFYGDETKVFFLRKDTAAMDFLLNQRKGPIQFVVAWLTETVFGSYDELLTRLPYALAGTLAVIVFYYLVKDLYARRVAALAALLFSFNGFFIAFSRTVQYQSFLILFGLLSIYFFNKYTHHGFRFTDRRQFQRIYLTLSGIFLALAYLAHWDAVFYDLVLALFILKYIFEHAKNERWSVVKDMFIYMAIPFLFLLGIFYIPYFSGGYFSEHVSGYISRRFSGSNQLPHNSSYTFWLYNPDLVYFIPFLFAPFAWSKFKEGLRTTTIIMFAWFGVPFVLFEFFVSNPGTHIQSYFIPLFILSALGIVYLYDLLKYKILCDIVSSVLAVGFIVMFAVSCYSYVPFVNTGYPWTRSYRGPLIVDPLDKNEYQYFIYGFPYDGGWRDVRAYFEANGYPRSFYTNDNLTIGEYYLHGVSTHTMTPEQPPEYYIYVVKNQEYLPIDPMVSTNYVRVYDVVKNNMLVAQIYKIK